MFTMQRRNPAHSHRSGQLPWLLLLIGAGVLTIGIQEAATHFAWSHGVLLAQGSAVAETSIGIALLISGVAGFARRR